MPVEFIRSGMYTVVLADNVVVPVRFNTEVLPEVLDERVTPKEFVIILFPNRDVPVLALTEKAPPKFKLSAKVTVATPTIANGIPIILPFVVNVQTPALVIENCAAPAKVIPVPNVILPETAKVPVKVMVCV